MQILLRRLNNIPKNWVELKPNFKKAMKKEIEKIQIQMSESHSSKPWIILKEKKIEKKDNLK